MSDEVEVSEEYRAAARAVVASFVAWNEEDVTGVIARAFAERDVIAARREREDCAEAVSRAESVHAAWEAIRARRP